MQKRFHFSSARYLVVTERSSVQRIELGKILTGRKRSAADRGKNPGRMPAAEETPTVRCDLADGSRVQVISEKLQSTENPFTSLFADRGFLSSLISPRLVR